MAKKNENKTTGTKKKQVFSFTAPGAMNVQLVGDFTHWQNSPVNMKKGARGVWKATVELGPGTHHYRFVVDGQWRDDPECTMHVPNPYGGNNAVRQVG